MSFIRDQIAAVVVSFPAFFLLTRGILLSYRTNLERMLSPVRYWLTYLTLFVAATLSLCTLIGVVAALLNGATATALLLKFWIVLALSLATYQFYRWELQYQVGDGTTKAANRKIAWLGGFAAAVVIAAACLGIVSVGSPKHAAQVAADNQRSADLTTISSAIEAECEENHKVPKAISDLPPGDNKDVVTSLRDPSSAQLYGYRRVSDNVFALSAVFDTDTTGLDLAVDPSAPGREYAYHKAGLVEFKHHVNIGTGPAPAPPTPGGSQSEPPKKPQPMATRAQAASAPQAPGHGNPHAPAQNKH
jgi:hypothetical protein